MRGDEFPGSFGSLGKWMFGTFFLNGDYAKMMKGTQLARMKAQAEAFVPDAAGR